MTTHKSKNKNTTDYPKDGAKKYIATMLMFIGLIAFAIILYVLILRMTVPLNFG